MPFQNEWEERQNKCFKAELDNSELCEMMSMITESCMIVNHIHIFFSLTSKAREHNTEFTIQHES